MKTNKITEQNILIAEFVGHKIDSSDPIRPLLQHSGYFVAPIPTYNSSWDFLMPVVSKCYEFAELGSDERTEIEESLLGIINIDDTFKAVVKFIEWHNKNESR